MMGALRTMLDMLRRRPEPEPRPVRVKAEPDREEQVRDLAKARQANDRAALGLVITSGRAMAAESAVQTRLRGMLAELDRGKDDHERG